MLYPFYENVGAWFYQTPTFIIEPFYNDKYDSCLKQTDSWGGKRQMFPLFLFTLTPWLKHTSPEMVAFCLGALRALAYPCCDLLSPIK